MAAPKGVAPQWFSALPEDKQQEAKGHFLQLWKEHGRLNSDVYTNMKKLCNFENKHVKDLKNYLNLNDDESDDDDDSFGSESDSEEAPKQQRDLLKMSKHQSKFPVSYLEGQYIIDKIVGKGAFGIVALAKATKNHPFLPVGYPVAIKVLNNVFDSAVGAKRIVRELRILRYMRDHPAVCKILDVKIPQPLNLLKFNKILMVLEFCPKELAKEFSDPKVVYDETQVKIVMHQLLYALKYMHTANFVHRDLKPQNIMLKKSKDKDSNYLNLKLIDLGLARCITFNRSRPAIWAEDQVSKPGEKKQIQQLAFRAKVTTHVVTRYYRAPEISLLQMKREGLPAVDVWSVGCIFGELLQMVPGNRRPEKRQILLKGAYDLKLSPQRYYYKGPRIPPTQLEVVFKFLGSPDKSFIQKIEDPELQKMVMGMIKDGKAQQQITLQEQFPHTAKASPLALDLFQKLLRYDAKKRLTVQEALDHPWFEDSPVDEEIYDLEYPQKVRFTFEDVTLSRHQIRCLVIDEVFKFNPHWKEGVETANDLQKMQQDLKDIKLEPSKRG